MREGRADQQKELYRRNDGRTQSIGLPILDEREYPTGRKTLKMAREFIERFVKIVLFDRKQSQFSRMNILQVELGMPSGKCCRICYDDVDATDMISPCKCKGSMQFIHRSCLRKEVVDRPKKVNQSACLYLQSTYRTARCALSRMP
jgi:hypothetical protein